jgi:glutamate-1-semialdehyde 2,1-aminomutase
MGCLFFTDRAVQNYDDALTCDTRAFARYYHAMLANGIYLPPSQFEAFFISTAHTTEDIDRTITANYSALADI